MPVPGWRTSVIVVGANAEKVTVAVCATVTVSVVSVAVKTEEPAVEDFAVKAATPDALVVEELVESVSVAPRLETRVTDLPASGLPPISLSVTAIVEVARPLFATMMGEATTDELPALATAADGSTSRPLGLNPPDGKVKARTLSTMVSSGR